MRKAYAQGICTSRATGRRAATACKDYTFSFKPQTNALQASKNGEFRQVRDLPDVIRPPA